MSSGAAPREYVVLARPSTNRVYAAHTPRLLGAEIGVVLPACGVEVSEPAGREIAGLDYQAFTSTAPVDDVAVAVGALSSGMALFELRDDLLAPVRLSRRIAFPDDLLSIPKYTGKTNEQLTALLLNLTLAASARPVLLIGGTGRVLDPVCGRGTTLNLALHLGLDSVGIDIDRRDIEALSGFLSTWAKTHRLPHHHDFGPLRRDRKVLGERLRMEVFASRADQKAGRGVRVEAFAADTLDADRLLGRERVDAIVADLPYGVAHGSHRGKDLQRRADDLVAEALPGWLRVLRPGGAIGLSFNTRTLSRERLAATLAANGLELAPYGDVFAHRVDASIHRDLMVARLP